MIMTRDIAWAAATDAGNRAARNAGRAKWNRTDLAAAIAEFNRLWPTERD